MTETSRHRCDFGIFIVVVLHQAVVGLHSLVIVSLAHCIELKQIQDRGILSNVESFDFHILSFCLVLNHDFVINMYIDFTNDAASNTATDDVTN